MPGPGGGSHGGGGFGGGGFSGGHGGGFGGGRGFGRGYGYRGPRFYGGFWGFPFFYGYGGGCLGGLLGMLMLPFILFLAVVVIFFATFSTGFDALAKGGYVYYNEETFQDYANAQYHEAFSAEPGGYEDKMLIAVLVDENYEEYYYIAWVGDHINGKINNLFGNDETTFGRTIESNVNLSNYKHSLDFNLAQTMRDMADRIGQMDLQNSFTCNETHVGGESRLVNRTEMDLTESTVNSGLAYFTEVTGIETVIVVENDVDVFGKTMPIVPIVIMVVLLILIGFLVYRAIKAYKRHKEDEANGTTNQGQNGNGWNNDNRRW